MTAGENKVHYDLVDVHVADVTIDMDAGTVTFGTPKRLVGSISMDLSAQGDQVKLRADGIDYYVTNSNNGYSGDFNIAQVPDWFREKYYGDTLSPKDKVLVENANAHSKPFALLYGFKGDVSHRRHCLYNVTAGRPNIKGENKENMNEPDTETMSLTASPLFDGKIKASTTVDTPAEVYENWNKSVWIQDTAAAAGGA